ncbi:CDP-diacylglycerol--serine O-phosphatidyltransferase [Spongorhabdus nitratireducens]
MKQINEEHRDQPDTDSPREEENLLVSEHIEEVAEGGQKVRRKGIYLLPNLFTTAALFCGFYAIVSGMSGQFGSACIAIFVAMILDGLDGRVARMTNTASAFGAQYDSLSDAVSFGLAPALVAFSWTLNEMGKVGWMLAFIYAACGALRLARFNTMAGSTDPRYFIGLPSPSGAALVAGMVWALSDLGVDGSQLWVSLFAGLVTALSGILMVSNVRYHSFKKIDFKARVPFFFILVAVLLFAVVFSDPPRVLLAIFMGYAVSGPILAVMDWRKKKTETV